MSTGHVAGRDGHVGPIAFGPELFDELRWMRQIGVHGQHIVARRVSETGDERATVSRFRLLHYPRVVGARGLESKVVRVPRE